MNVWEWYDRLTVEERDELEREIERDRAREADTCGGCGQVHACARHPESGLFLNVLGNQWRCNTCHGLVDACL